METNDECLLQLSFNTKLEMRGGIVRLIERIITNAGFNGVVLVHIDRTRRASVRRMNTFQVKGVELTTLSRRLMFRAQGDTKDSCYEGRIFFARYAPADAVEMLRKVDGVSSFLSLSPDGLVSAASLRADALKERGVTAGDSELHQTLGLLSMMSLSEGHTLTFELLMDAACQLLEDEPRVNVERRVRMFAREYLLGGKKEYRPIDKLVAHLRELDSCADSFGVETAKMISARLTEVRKLMSSSALGESQQRVHEAEQHAESCRAAYEAALAAVGAAKSEEEALSKERARMQADAELLQGFMSMLEA